MLARREFAFVGDESDPKNGTPYVIVDGEATTTLTSSSENCTDVKPTNIDIHLAEGRVAMVTTHLCSKTNCFRSRTGEFRAVTTSAFIVTGLTKDLLSVKSLNHQSYCVIHHPDPEEPGIFLMMERWKNQNHLHL
jgi:hypothetical protein